MAARLGAISRHLCGGSVNKNDVNSASEGPLHGIRVLDLTQMVSGPMGTQILGDMGADVIKIEPLTGAAERGSSRAKITSPLFALVNRNKRSVSLDLKSEEGRSLFYKLIPTADVIVQNFRPGVAARMGIGYEDVQKANPRIIYMSISGFGQTGPYTKNRVYDPVIQAVSGLASVQADETGRPRMMRLVIPDKVTALTSAQAITAALVQRGRTGVGTSIELSMLDAVISFAWGEAFAQEAIVDGQAPNHEYSRDMVFQTLDGYITCGAVQDKEWHALCTALQKPEWTQDERFATATSRALHRNVRFEMTEGVLRKMTTAEALERLTQHQVPNAEVNHPRAKVLTNPQVVKNKLIETVEHPWAPFPMLQPRLAAQFSNAPYRLRHNTPLLGENTREILRQAGVSEGTLDAAEKNGVIRTVQGEIPAQIRRDGRLYDPSSA
eukprot:m.52472 g.52472  ORF g.52472 m.52472 type:complete len:439 (+) comp9104_c0_seq2:116-1432(+)